MSEFKLKKNIGEGMKMFWKYQLAVWLSIQNFYSHLTKVTHKCECLDIWNVRQTTSGVYAITVTMSTYHSRSRL